MVHHPPSYSWAEITITITITITIAITITITHHHHPPPFYSSTEHSSCTLHIQSLKYFWVTHTHTEKLNLDGQVNVNHLLELCWQQGCAASLEGSTLRLTVVGPCASVNFCQVMAVTITAYISTYIYMFKPEMSFTSLGHEHIFSDEGESHDVRSTTPHAWESEKNNRSNRWRDIFRKWQKRVCPLLLS